MTLCYWWGRTVKQGFKVLLSFWPLGARKRKWQRRNNNNNSIIIIIINNLLLLPQLLLLSLRTPDVSWLIPSCCTCTQLKWMAIPVVYKAVMAPLCGGAVIHHDHDTHCLLRLADDTISRVRRCNCTWLWLSKFRLEDRTQKWRKLIVMTEINSANECATFRNVKREVGRVGGGGGGGGGEGKERKREKEREKERGRQRQSLSLSLSLSLRLPPPLSLSLSLSLSHTHTHGICFCKQPCVLCFASSDLQHCLPPPPFPPCAMWWWEWVSHTTGRVSQSHNRQSESVTQPAEWVSHTTGRVSQSHNRQSESVTQPAEWVSHTTGRVSQSHNRQSESVTQPAMSPAANSYASVWWILFTQHKRGFIVGTVVEYL